LEIYDPKTEKFSFWGRLKHFRGGTIGAIQLKNGQILITGGEEKLPMSKEKGDYNIKGCNVTELVSINEHLVTISKPMYLERAEHTMTLLDDGRVLVVGGTSEKYKDYSFAELYDPESQKFSPLTGPHSIIAAEAFSLPNQKVLIFGSHSINDAPSPDDNNVIIFDVSSKKFLKGPKVLYQRGSTGNTSLKNGDVLVTGGFFSWKNADQFREAEIYKI
jgi:hypothetical protein